MIQNITFFVCTLIYGQNTMCFSNLRNLKSRFTLGICTKKVRNHEEKQYFIGLFKKHNSYFQREITDKHCLYKGNSELLGCTHVC